MSELGPTRDRDFLEIWNSVIGFYKIWILHLGRRYNILRTLAREKNPLSASDLSKSVQLPERAVSLWCDAAYSAGFVEKEGSGYILPRRFVPLLIDEDDIRFIGGLPSYLALRSLDFGSFDLFFKEGRVPPAQSHLGEAFHEGTIWDHTAFIRLILEKETVLSEHLDRGARVLDVGSGAGGWTVKLAEKYPSSTFIGIDPDPDAIAKATFCARERGLKNVEFRNGAAETMEFTGEFDVAYLGEVLNLTNSKVDALRACHKALRKGGILTICEGLASDLGEARKAENQLVHCMQLDFALQGSRFFTKSELIDLIGLAGFHGARFHDMGGGLWFILADR